eukprot:382680-Amphidinium_carterae.1
MERDFWTSSEIQLHIVSKARDTGDNRHTGRLALTQSFMDQRLVIHPERQNGACLPLRFFNSRKVLRQGNASIWQFATIFAISEDSTTSIVSDNQASTSPRGVRLLCSGKQILVQAVIAQRAVKPCSVKWFWRKETELSTMIPSDEIAQSITWEIDMPSAFSGVL